MARYIIKRLVLLLIIILFVSVASFFLVHLLPGNPTATILGPNATPQNVATVDRQLGLNRPLWEQYFIWIGHVFQGNLGQSYTTHQTTTSIIAESFPIDLELIIFSQIIAFAIAFPMAMHASRRPNRLFDQASNSTTFAMLALPPFVIAPILVLIFAVHWHVFPGPASYVPLTQNFLVEHPHHDAPRHRAGPGLDRGVLPPAAKRPDLHLARGLHHHGPVQGPLRPAHHVAPRVRPSSISLLASAGVTIGSLIAGTFVVELLLQMPGLGYQLISV